MKLITNPIVYVVTWQDFCEGNMVCKCFNNIKSAAEFADQCEKKAIVDCRFQGFSTEDDSFSFSDIVKSNPNYGIYSKYYDCLDGDSKIKIELHFIND